MEDLDPIEKTLFEAAEEGNDLASNILDRISGMGKPQLAEFLASFVGDLTQLADMFKEDLP